MLRTTQVIKVVDLVPHTHLATIKDRVRNLLRTRSAAALQRCREVNWITASGGKKRTPFTWPAESIWANEAETEPTQNDSASEVRNAEVSDVAESLQLMKFFELSSHAATLMLEEKADFEQLFVLGPEGV
jgi:hypothetical protein